jgi:hypothetical protein
MAYRHLLVASAATLGGVKSVLFMPSKLATCGWLLLALAATTTLAQRPPKRKSYHKAGGAQPVQAAPEARKKAASLSCYLPLEEQEVFALVVEAPNQVYTYVEQMPALPQASERAGVVAALQGRVVVPATAPAGRVFVQFVATKEGLVSQPQVLKGLRADVDSAVVVATRQLPCFLPGKHNGQPVSVRLVLPVTILEAGRQADAGL